MAGHHVREAGGDVKNKPPYLSQAGRPIQTLLTFSFSSTITTIYNHIVMKKTLALVGAKLVKKPQFERINHDIFLQ